MKWQKNLIQTKIPQMPKRGLSETEITNLLDKDFKLKIINMLKELQKIFKISGKTSRDRRFEKYSI